MGRLIALAFALTLGLVVEVVRHSGAPLGRPELGRGSRAYDRLDEDHARQPIQSEKTNRNESRVECVQPSVVAPHVPAAGEERLDRADHGQDERPQGRAPVRPRGDERGDELRMYAR